MRWYLNNGQSWLWDSKTTDSEIVFEMCSNLGSGIYDSERKHRDFRNLNWLVASEGQARNYLTSREHIV